MLTKCANPSCSTPLIYLREGKIFMMEHHPQSQVQAGPAQAKPVARVEHFWLCGPCSTEMTVTYNSEHGVAVVPKAKVRQAAA
ncbi:MAG TPA: hypothetical protein VI685_04920 [Candidatus Angelobacter sp.]